MCKHTCDHTAASHALRQDLVMRWELGQHRIQRSVVGPELFDLLRGGTVRFGQDEVHHHHSGAPCGQLVHDLCHDGAWPRPLPYRRQAGVVNGDHTHRNVVHIRGRMQLLQLIKRQVANAHAKQRILKLHDQQGAEHPQREQQTQQGGQQLAHGLSLSDLRLAAPGGTLRYRAR